MDSSQHVLEDQVTLQPEYTSATAKEWQEDVLDIAIQALFSSTEYKAPRMRQIALFEYLYNNDITPKLRQLFNVPVPVFPGMIDTLLADFNDEIQLKFKPNNTAQYLIVPKIQAQWENERDSMAPNARWNYKARTDRFNAAISGVGILKNYAENVPTYRNIFEVVNYGDFHCQPLGGGILENHLFAGQEGIMRTLEDIVSDDNFDKGQRAKLEGFTGASAWSQYIKDAGTKLARFHSMELRPEQNSYAGAKTINLCEFIVTYKGVRYFIVFDPYTRIWLRCEKWTDIRPSGLLPWIAWQTHEDHKNFWSKSYADDLYWVADAIITMVNQELTNREKKNYNARAYDKGMFEDLQKLDEAQYMPDTLVPVNVTTKPISAGIYEFQTAELKGTVDLVGFLAMFTGQQTGITAGSQGQNQASKKPTVVVEETKQVSKRTGLRSDSYKEAYAQIGVLYMEDLREYMPPRLSIQTIGENGFIEEAELRRIEVRRAGVLGCTIISTSEQENRDKSKKQNRINALLMLQKTPNASKYEKEVILRDIGGFDDAEVNFYLDAQSYESRKQIAHASENIQNMLLGKPTDVYYGAEVTYLQYIENYMIDNKNLIKDKAQAFAAHLQEMFPVVVQNMKRKAQQQIMKKTVESFLQAGPQMPGTQGAAPGMGEAQPTNNPGEVMQPTDNGMQPGM